MSATYIVAAARTPIGKFGGAFVDLSPVELGSQVMQAALSSANVSGDALDLVIFGNILKHGHGQLFPRHAALAAGIPETVDGYAVDMLCSSGMMAVMNARPCHPRRRGRSRAGRGRGVHVTGRVLSEPQGALGL